MTAKKRGAATKFNDAPLIERVAMCELAQGESPNREEAYRRATAGLEPSARAAAVVRLRKARPEIEAATADILQRRMPAARKALAEGRFDDAAASGVLFVSNGAAGIGPVPPALLGPVARDPEQVTPKVLAALAHQATPAQLAEALRNIAADLESGRLAASDVVRDAVGKLVGAARDGLGKKPI
jgi:hypothetical protein